MKENKLRNVLLIYWILIPCLFYLYIFLFSFNNNSSVGQLLTEVPSITITFLLSCLLLLKSYVLYNLTKYDIDYGLLNKFLNFSLIQQIITFNIIGVFIVYKYLKNIKNKNSEFSSSKKLKVFTYLTMFLVGILSIFVMILIFLLNKA